MTHFFVYLHPRPFPARSVDVWGVVSMSRQSSWLERERGSRFKDLKNSNPQKNPNCRTVGQKSKTCPVLLYLFVFDLRLFPLSPCPRVHALTQELSLLRDSLLFTICHISKAVRRKHLAVKKQKHRDTHTIRDLDRECCYHG